MSGLDYDVIVIGSGFGGSVSALRLTEKGYKVGVMESGKRWADSELPETSWDVRRFLWEPEIGLFGIQRISLLDDVGILHGAGVGGGSLVYAQTLYVPPKPFFEASEWSHITDWQDELTPYYDQALRMLGVVDYPYMNTDADRLLKEVAEDMGRGHTFVKTPVGVYFGTPGQESEDPYFGGAGPRRKGCISCGECTIGCRHGAKNKLTTNYLYLAEAKGAVVHPWHEVTEVIPLDDGGYEVQTRKPGLAGIVGKHKVFRAQHVIFSAHAYGTAKLLHKLKHDGQLANISDRLGKHASTNAEALLAADIPYKDFKKHPNRHVITPGSVAITSSFMADEITNVQPVVYGVGSNAMAFNFILHPDGEEPLRTTELLKKMLENPSAVMNITNPRHWSERTIILLVMQSRAESIDLRWEKGHLRSEHGEGGALQTRIKVADDVLKRLAEKIGANKAAFWFEAIHRTATAHFIGGVGIGDNEDEGAIDPYQRMFGYPGLHVVDGSVIPTNPGVNPSLSITALAERAMAFWPNKGEEDERPKLGNSYRRLKPIKPKSPAVPEHAQGALRLPY